MERGARWRTVTAVCCSRPSERIHRPLGSGLIRGVVACAAPLHVPPGKGAPKLAYHLEASRRGSSPPVGGPRRVRLEGRPAPLEQ